MQISAAATTKIYFETEISKLIRIKNVGNAPGATKFASEFQSDYSKLHWFAKSDVDSFDNLRENIKYLLESLFWEHDYPFLQMTILPVEIYVTCKNFGKFLGPNIHPLIPPELEDSLVEWILIVK